MSDTTETRLRALERAVRALLSEQATVRNSGVRKMWLDLLAAIPDPDAAPSGESGIVRVGGVGVTSEPTPAALGITTEATSDGHAPDTPPPSLDEWIDTLTAAHLRELRDLRAKVEAVREMHTTPEGRSPYYCPQCRDAYPCATIRALDAGGGA